MKNRTPEQTAHTIPTLRSGTLPVTWHTTNTPGRDTAHCVLKNKRYGKRKDQHTGGARKETSEGCIEAYPPHSKTGNSATTKAGSTPKIK